MGPPTRTPLVAAANALNKPETAASDGIDAPGQRRTWPDDTDDNEDTDDTGEGREGDNITDTQFSHARFQHTG